MPHFKLLLIDALFEDTTPVKIEFKFSSSNTYFWINFKTSVPEPDNFWLVVQINLPYEHLLFIQSIFVIEQFPICFPFFFSQTAKSTEFFEFKFDK